MIPFEGDMEVVAFSTAQRFVIGNYNWALGIGLEYEYLDQAIRWFHMIIGSLY